MSRVQQGLQCSLDELFDPWKDTETVRVARTSSKPDGGQRTRLQGDLGLPTAFWSMLQQESNGFFAARDHFSPSGTLEAHTTTTRFLVKVPRSPGASNKDVKPYGWVFIGVFTRWQVDCKTIVLIQTQDCHEIRTAIANLSTELAQSQCRSNPYAAHVILLEQITAIYSSSIWAWTGEIRTFERLREANQSEESDVLPIPDYDRVNEAPRHIFHCTEILAAAIDVVENMIEEHQAFQVQYGELFTSSPSRNVARNVTQALKAQRSLLVGNSLQAKALEGRLGHQVSLASATITQHDSKVVMQIQKATAADSASTTTISFLGLIFLPATFVCSLFSTTFFSLQPAVDLTARTDGPNGRGADAVPAYWIMSDRFWVFWAVSLPLTVFTVGVWWLTSGRWRATMDRLRKQRGPRGRRDGSEEKGNPGVTDRW
ncbi:hypothetical protein CAC42_1620 [Sphaceloma murrayae]|uniref:Uncharacterized protein n=1 Tax=Sphaceloma murrayae TaxID=2082308 RepID=A0A2K1R398_9PEZI|nr:hypothetical protein CAC42_1620 [Sphaceloma murrayae]